MSDPTYKTTNKQEIFDFVVRKLAEQGGPATNRGQCVYRAESGRKCAFGWLIPDDEYHRSMECNTLNIDTGSMGSFPDHRITVPQENAVFIRSLQVVHDNARNGDDWDLESFKTRFHQVAATWDIVAWVVYEVADDLAAKYAES